MATKTISIDHVAYERLVRAKLGPGDSFSKVIRRARWDREVKTCEGVLASLGDLAVTEEATLDLLEAAQLRDAVPDDPQA